jgi:hypothetical protein
MRYALTIALVGERTPHGDVLPPVELEKPYRDRATTSLEVDEDQGFGDILMSAADDLGLEGWAAEPRWVGFYRPEDAHSSPPDFALKIPILDGHRRGRWVGSPFDFPFGDVVRAAESGFLYGDPTRFHIALVPPVGDGVLPDWTAIVHALEVMKTVGEILAIPGGVVESAALIRRRLKARSDAAAEAVKARSPRWHQMGADPYAFEEWLTGGAWRPEEIAAVIDCSDEEAEAILWAFGFARSKDGSWRQELGEEARLLADNMRMMIRMSISQANDDQLREIFRERMEVLLETGRAPKLDWRVLDWLRPTSQEPEEVEKQDDALGAGGRGALGWLRRRFR